MSNCDILSKKKNGTFRKINEKGLRKTNEIGTVLKYIYKQY